MFESAYTIGISKAFLSFQAHTYRKERARGKDRIGACSLRKAKAALKRQTTRQHLVRYKEQRIQGQ